MTNPDQQPWADAVADAAEGAPCAADEALRWELERLWGDLDSAYHDASNGIWSMGCEGITTRIVVLTRIAGPVSWESVGYPLILNGLFDGILTAAGITYRPPDLKRVAATAKRSGATQCPECNMWADHHTRPCSRRSRTRHEQDQERLAAFGRPSKGSP